MDKIRVFSALFINVLCTQKTPQKLMPGTDYQIGVVKDIHVEQYKRIAMNGLLCHCMHTL